MVAAAQWCVQLLRAQWWPQHIGACSCYVYNGVRAVSDVRAAAKTRKATQLEWPDCGKSDAAGQQAETELGTHSVGLY